MKRYIIIVVTLLINSACGATAVDSGNASSAETSSAFSGTLTLAGGATSTNTLNIGVNLVSSHTDSIVAYIISETATVPTAEADNWIAIDPVMELDLSLDFALSAMSGDHTVYAWLKDSGGTVTDTIQATISLDINQVTAALTLNDGAKYTKSADLTVAVSGLSPIGIQSYALSEKATSSAVSPSAWMIHSGKSIQKELSTRLTTGDGTKSLYLHLVEVNGSITTTQAEIILDGTAPSGTVIINNGNKLTANAQVSLSLTGSDMVGVVAYATNIANAVPAETSTQWTAITANADLDKNINFQLPAPIQGKQTVNAWLRDGAGNVSSVIQGSIEGLGIYGGETGSNHNGQYTSIALDSSNVAWISARDLESPYRVRVYNYYSSGDSDIAYIIGTGDIGAGTAIAIDSEPTPRNWTN